MSLDWKITEICDYETLCWKTPQPGELETNTRSFAGRPVTKDGRILNMITHALIWGCLEIGIHEITPHNYEEWYIRYRSARLAYGSAGVGITVEDVKAHVGLWTNAFPNTTAARFNKALGEILADRVRREMRTVQEVMGCGCPEHIVNDEGHQEGCALRTR